MALYLAMQIRIGKLTYTEVIAKFPNYKEIIDNDLIEKGYDYLIVEMLQK